MPRPVGETLEDKGAVGGLGLAASRKPKARISMKKAYGFLVWTRVQSPPSPLRYNGRELNLTIFYFFGPPSPLHKTKKAQPKVESFSLEVRTRFERVYTVLQTVD